VFGQSREKVKEELSNPQFQHGIALVMRSIAQFIGGCKVGRSYRAIQPDGIVTPCVFMPLAVGDLKQEKFIDIWNHSPILAEIRVRDD
ncbi:hypothetical protein LCGC14_2726450, partial [marine sediment metagenome]